MNPLASMNKALDELERHLEGEIDQQRLAQIAGCSPYHFKRMFSHVAGMPLGEYIRKRRLSVAVALLQRENAKIIEVALRLGYESPDAFSKAFTAMHGATPSQVRRGAAAARAFGPLRFQLTVKGGMEMDYRMVEKDAFRIVGFRERITVVFEGVNPQMEALTARMTPEAATALKALCDVEPQGILSVSANFADRTGEGSELDQYLGVATTRQAPQGFDCLEVEASCWAVFSAVGSFPQALQQTWAAIYAQWFPSSGYELTGGPELLWNESSDTTRPDYRSEIWVPVKKPEAQR